jgi:hypothetical protein
MRRYNIDYNFLFPEAVENQISINVSFASVGSDCEDAKVYLESKMLLNNNQYNIRYREEDYQLNFTSGSFLNCHSL